MTPPRRCWTFTLRSLFVVVAVLAVAAALARAFPLAAAFTAMIVVLVSLEFGTGLPKWLRPRDQGVYEE